MKKFIQLSMFVILISMLSGCAIHTGILESSAYLSQPNFDYIHQNINGSCQTTRVLGFGGLFKADLVEIAKKEMLKQHELESNQALANVTVDWKHSRYIIVKTTKCTVTADVVEFR